MLWVPQKGRLRTETSAGGVGSTTFGTNGGVMKKILGALAVLGLLLSPAAQGQSALPPLQPDIVQSSQWVCTGPQNRDLVRITLDAGSTDAVQLRQDCSGRIGRLEVIGRMADCIKVSPVSPPAHDLYVGGGYCRATAPPDPGVHQDGIQMGGGANLHFSNFVWDMLGGGGGNIFIAGFNGGTPTDFACNRCAVGPRHPNPVRTPSDPGSGVSNSLLCAPASGRAVFSPASGDKGGNTIAPLGDPRCTFEGLAAYVNGSPPACSPACAPTCDEQIAALSAERDQARAERDALAARVDALQVEQARLGAIIDVAAAELAKK